MEKAPENDMARAQRALEFIEGKTRCPHLGNLAKDCLRCLDELLSDTFQEGFDKGMLYADKLAKLGA